MGTVINHRSFHGRSSGFTLVELLVVAAMLTILFAIVAMRLDVSKDTEEKIAKRELRQIREAIMGDAMMNTGFYHETRTGDQSFIIDDHFKVPPHVAMLVDKAAVMHYLKINENDLVIVWDPNHRRGYRPGGYLKGDGIEDVENATGGNPMPFPTMIDPWGRPYIIMDHLDPENARIVSKGSDEINEDDNLSLYIFEVQGSG